jgi:ketosteroid isomerase-like protein
MSPGDFLRAYQAVANAHDLEATLSMIADHAIFLFSDETAHIGKDAIRKAMQTNFDTIKNERYRVRHVTWPVSSDEFALCVYEFEWTGEIHDQPVSGSGRGTTAIRRIDGNWRIVHEHLSKGGL